MTERIPNRFHFIFGLKKQTEPFHLCHFLCLESCYQINQPETIYFHYLHEPYGPYWELAKPRVTMVKVGLNSVVSKHRYGLRHRFNKKFIYAHHADFIRLEKLEELGGVYADIDTLFIRKYPAHLFEKEFVLGRENPIQCQTTGQYLPSLCNALIMAAPDSRFGHLWLERMPDYFNGTWSNHSTLLPQKLSEEHPESIHIEPSRSFYRYMWTPKDIYTLFEDMDTNQDEAYSLHLWAHLWWSKKRRDYSNFHQALLTEDYVRRAETTYGALARRFLP